MAKDDMTAKAAGAPLPLPFFYGWFVVALSFFANLPAATEFASA